MPATRNKGKSAAKRMLKKALGLRRIRPADLDGPYLLPAARRNRVGDKPSPTAARDAFRDRLVERLCGMGDEDRSFFRELAGDLWMSPNKRERVARRIAELLAGSER